ncbi:TRIM3 [Branchiostoma lanceolatum]|uniref:TRIM3 protein n=1 Tax=Branchiostoma lanceolatum TaxID=7740 RepID=A0A8J9ZXG6_BRALA|nr:TRIM3 [Branchiostoma lanceolatum]
MAEAPISDVVPRGTATGFSTEGATKAMLDIETENSASCQTNIHDSTDNSDRYHENEDDDIVDEMPMRSDDSNVAGIRHFTGGLRPNPQKSRDPNPMYKKRVTNPNQTSHQNVQNCIYRPSEPAFTEPSNSDNSDNAQPCGVTHQEDKTTLGPTDNDDCASIQPNRAANEAGAVSTRTPASRTDDCSTCIRQHAVANQEGCVPASSTANSDGVPDIQPYAVANQEGCVPASRTADSDGVSYIQPYAVANQEDGVLADSPFIHPYAVAYQEDNSDDTHSIKPYAVRFEDKGDDDRDMSSKSDAADENGQSIDDVNIIPYAVAYMSQDDTATVEEAQAGQASSTGNDLSFDSSGRGSSKHESDSQPTDGTMPDPPAARVQVRNVLVPNPMYVPNAQPAAEANCDNYSGVSERIVFGGGGTEPGRFRSNHGVVVSADKEIFVTDLYNKRVQVFNMNGDFVRLFPTVVSNDDEMFPADVAIDKDGLLWVVGKSSVTLLVTVVRYTRGGQPMTTFSVPQRPWFAKIAVDIRHNTVIVEANNEIFHFRLDGSFHGRFEKREGYVNMGYIVLDKENRNLLVTDYADTGVHVYNRSGHWLFKFGTNGFSKGQLRTPRGICVDTSGHIMVANSGNSRIDMFTSRGEFVRTVEDKTTLGPADNDDSASIQPYGAANEDGAVSTRTRASRTDDCSTCIRPHAVANQKGCVPASSIAHSDGVPYIQPHAVANQEGCVPASSTADSDGIPDIQPYAVANQEGCVPASSTANYDGMTYIQPYAVANQEGCVPASSTADSDGVPYIQPYAVANQEGCVPSSSTANYDGVPYIHPYAVAYQEDNSDDTHSIKPYAVRFEDKGDDVRDMSSKSDAADENGQSIDDVNITPYAVAYMSQDDTATVEEAQAGQASSTGNDLSFDSSGRGSSKHESDSQPTDGTMPDPPGARVQVRNVLVPNPMYVPNAQPAAEADCDNNTGDSERIVFGGEGTEPGRFRNIDHGVVVSADKEIFVTDLSNKRVQVFNMNGDFVRLFPTVVPNDGEMFPSDVAIDKDGLLWVVGKSSVTRLVTVVRYTRGGQPMTTFSVPQRTSFAKIAVDIRHNTIIVEANDEIFHFRLDGSFHGRFQKREGYISMGYIALDKENRNLLVTDYAVHVYNHSGHWLFKFGTHGVSEGQLRTPRGICVDTSGHVIVANSKNRRVDMFTSRGEFVRTVVTIADPWDLALGPDGELVVTNVHNNSVTIFPHRIVFPHE